MAAMTRPTQSGIHATSISGPYNDRRLGEFERIDQRYGNYTYGPDAQYATDRADHLQEEGSTASATLGESGFGGSLWNNGQNIATRETPQTDFSAADATLGRQGDLSNRLTQFAEQGPGPSRAQANLQANTAQGMRQQLALAGSGRGAGGAASAYRDAMANQTIMQGAANARAAEIGAAEDDMWRQRQLQAYGQDASLLDSMAGQQSTNAQFQTQAELEAQAQRDQASLGYQQAAVDATTRGYQQDLAYEQEARANLENEAAANQAYEDNLTTLAVGGANARAARQKGASASDEALGVISAAGPIMGMISDRRQKKNIREDDELNDRYAALAG